MRLLTLSLLSMLATAAFADQLIDIPTARKIPDEDIRYEFRASPYSGGSLQHFLGIGLGPSFEVDFRDLVVPGDHSSGTCDFSYNLIPALPGISPAISFGVQDSANLTPDGRRFYAVSTFRNEMDAISGNVYADITLGVQVGSLTSPFVGVSVPFSRTLFLIADHSGYRLSSGIELRPIPKVAIRFISREQKALVSLSALVKF